MDIATDQSALRPKAPRPAVGIVRARLAVSAEFLVLGSIAGVWAVHIPIVQARLQIDPAVIGLALLVMAIGAVFTMPLTGVFLSRFGSRLTTAFLGIAYPMIAPLAIYSGSVPFLFVSLLFLGAGMGALDVAMNTQAAEIEVARGRPTMSSFHGSFSVGALLGAACGGALIGLGFNDGSAALFIALVMLVVGIVASFNLWPSGRPVAGGPRLSFPPPALIGLGVITFLAFAGEGAVADWSALYLATVKGSSIAAASSGYVAFSIAMVICRLFGDPVVARIGGTRTIIGGGLLTALGMTIAVVSPNPFISAAGFALVGIGIANVVPVAFSAASRTPNLPAGAGVAAVTTLGYSGFLVLPPVLGFIARGYGLSAALVVVALMGLVIASLSRLVRR